jgi:acetylxylan esterase
MFQDQKELIMHLHGSPRFVRSLIASLLLLGLVVVAVWIVPQRPSTAHAASGSLVQVTNFGTNPTGLQMYLYVPPSVKAHPQILLALHQCTGSGPGFFSGSEFANLADQYGFIVIYPSVTRSGQCWDVYSNQGLARNGGSDNTGLISMITYVEQHNNGDSSNVYVTGASSGAMMTNVMLAEYPDVFKAGSAFMGVPYHCFSTGAASATSGSTWNSSCANGQISMTAQQWGDLARAADPGYSGARPRMQLWHGTADGTLNYNNFGEEIKQWTNVLGVSQTPSLTDSPVSGWTRTRYGSTGIGGPVEGISIAGAGHVLPENGMAAYAIQFMGLNATSSNPTPTPTVGGSTPTPTPTRGTTPTPTTGITPTPTTGSGSCSVHYAVSSQWNVGFTASISITNTSSTAINGWSLKFSFANGQTITQLWNGSVSQSGSSVTITNASYNGSIPANSTLNSPPGFNGSWTGSNGSPTAFTLNGAACTVA